MERGFNPRTLILLASVLGLVGGAWLGGRLAHETIFLGLWSGLSAVVGAAIGVWAGYMLSKYL